MVKELGAFGAGAGLMVGASLALTALGGALHQPAQHDAAPRPSTSPSSASRPPRSPVSPSPSSTPTGSPSRGGSAVAAQQMAAALGRASVVVVPPQPSHAPSPRPSSTPRPRPLLSVRAQVIVPKVKESP